MGKAQKKRAMRRHNPVRVPDSHLQQGLAGATAAASSIKRQAILPIIDKISSADVQERIWACAAISNLIQNDPSTRRLLQGKNVVGALISRLGDEVEEVVVEAAGALRNLCIDGGHEICAEMYNKGILPPLKDFVPKISAMLDSYLSNPKGAPENASRLVYEFAENVITLFWCLSETSNKALNAVNDINLPPFLMAFLDSNSREKLPIATIVAAAQCLYVLTEENEPASQEIRVNAQYINCLISIVQTEPNQDAMDVTVDTRTMIQDLRRVTLRTLICGILRNIMPLPPLVPAAQIDLDRSIILPFLVPRIKLNLSHATESVTEILESQQDDTEKIQRKPIPGAASDHKSESEMKLEKIEAELRVIKLALELITAICAELPDPEDNEDEEIEEEWEEQEEGEDQLESKMEEDASLKHPLPNGVPKAESVPSKSLDFLSHLVPSLLELIQPTPLSFAPAYAPSPHPPTTSALGGIHIAALECLNNIFLSVADSELISSNGEARRLIGQVWNQVWSMLSIIGRPQGIGSGPEVKMEVWRISLGVLWGVARICRGQPEIAPDEERVKVLIEIADAAADEETKVKCIGILECLSMNPQFPAANKIISEYLLSLLPSSTKQAGHPEVVIQAASSLIDIFSDEASPWDVNFRQGKWETILFGSISGVKKAVKAIDRRKEGGKELRRRGDEVVENLVAFVKYRKDLRL